MASNNASADLLQFCQQQAIHPDELDHLAKMYRSVSNRPLSTQKASKRKSRSSIEPRSSRLTRMQATTEMDRHLAMSVQSAPATVASTKDSSFRGMKNSPTIESYQDHSLDPFNTLDIESPRRKRSRGANSHIVHGKLQTPQEYFSSNMNSNAAAPIQPNYTTLQIHDCHHLSLDTEQYSATSSHFAISPPAISSIDSPSLSFDWATEMSREPTRNSFSNDLSLEDDMSMLRMASMTSNMSSSHPHHTQLVFSGYPQHSQQQFLYPHYDHSSPINNFTSHQASLDISPSSTSPPIDFEFYPVAPRLNRSSSDQSSASNRSLNEVSRSQRRHQETMQQSQRSLAPADSQQSTLLSHMEQQCQGVKMERVVSQDGEEKVKAVISKAERKYTRPSVPKLMCPHCNDHPEGFRGDHELQRHTSHFHSKLRKVWVCVDSSEDKTFLANCKACRTQKKYGAYYNAAAHLRRAHFNPRKRGRKAKNEIHEKRGGKGGGNWPPMENLKNHWMQEVEEEVNDLDALEDQSEDTEPTEETGLAENTIDVPYYANFDNADLQFSQASLSAIESHGSNSMIPTMTLFDDVCRLMPQATGMMYSNPTDLYFPEPAQMPGELWAIS